MHYIMKRLFFCLAATALLVSCSFFTESDRLRLQNDSLMVVKSQIENEMNGYFATMNEIESNLKRITEIEGFLSQQNSTEGVPTDQRDRINQNIVQVAKILENNKNEIEKLKKQLKNSNFNLKELEKKIAQLNDDLVQKSLKIQQLETELAQKDELIVQQQVAIRGLQSDLSDLESDLETKNQIIQNQEETIHTAWYVFGTRKELKEQKILPSSGLFGSKKVLRGDFNKDYFVKVDAREMDSIPLYSHRAKILTTHPETSYKLEKEGQNFVLIITDKSAFWSISRYLVVEVD